MKAPFLRLPVLAPPLSAHAAGPAREGDWFVDPKAAQKESMQTNRPQLVWFLDSLTSQERRRLETDIFSRPQFKTWFPEKVVPLRPTRAPARSGIGRCTASTRSCAPATCATWTGTRPGCPCSCCSTRWAGHRRQTLPDRGMDDTDAFMKALKAFSTARVSSRWRRASGGRMRAARGTRPLVMPPKA